MKFNFFLETLVQECKYFERCDFVTINLIVQILYSHLESIKYLDGSSISDYTLQIQSLNLEQNNLTDISILSNQTSFVSLNIASNLIAFFDLSKPMNHLRTLNISNNPLSKLNFVTNQFIHLSIIYLSKSQIDLFMNLQANQRRFKQNNVAVFCRSLHLQSDYSNVDCFQILYFIKLNIHLNLYTYSQIYEFFSQCLWIDLDI